MRAAGTGSTMPHDHEPAAHDHGAHEESAHDHGAHEHGAHEHAAHDHGGGENRGAHHGSHAHGRGSHGHSHAPKDFGSAFVVAIALNVAIVVLQALYGYLGNSVALIADAGHNLSDVLGLAVAWIAAGLAKRPPSARFTYGLRGSSILAALFNAVFLLVAIGALSWEAVRRLAAPEPVAGGTVMVVAAIGLVLNAFTAWLFAGGRHGDLNVRGAYLHMAADAAVSAGVVVAGLVILLTGWLWLDPVVSLAINAVIVWGTWSLLRDSVALSLAAVPPGIEIAAVRRCLAETPEVEALHDLHVWPMSTTETALTAHLVMPNGHPGDAALMRLADTVRTRFGIGHVTLQVETDAATDCSLKPETVV